MATLNTQYLNYLVEHVNDPHITFDEWESTVFSKTLDSISNLMAEEIKTGDTVKMSEWFKTDNPECKEHIEEFGECEGIVEDLIDYGTAKGPEYNVKWLPSGLRYGYELGKDVVKVIK